MFLNHERIENTHSKIVHGVHPKTRKTFCGYPYGQVIGIAFIEKHWGNWRHTDKPATCATCRYTLAAIRRNKK